MKRAFRVTSAMPTLMMSAILTSMLVTTATAITLLPNADETMNCCPDGKILDRSSNCTDGRKVRLMCPDGYFPIDPLENSWDNFSIVNGEMVLEDNALVIQPHRFCLGITEKTKHTIAIICAESEDFHPSWMHIFFCILSIISTLFLVLTLVVYLILPELRDLEGKAMICSMTSLIVCYVILAIQQVVEPATSGSCVARGFIMYYAFMSAFFWLNLISFNVWRTVWFRSFVVTDKTLFVIFCVIGYGASACFLIAALATHHTEGYHLKPGFGERSCWFGGNQETWTYFYGPIACLLAINVVYYGLTCWRLWHECRQYSGSNLRVLRFKCLLYLKLFLVMGVTWIFEIFSAFSSEQAKYWWIPTDVLNCLQGLVIFLLLVATRKRVRKLLAKKRPCGIRFPRSWTAAENDECESALPEEVELSQST